MRTSLFFVEKSEGSSAHPFRELHVADSGNLVLDQLDLLLDVSDDLIGLQRHIEAEDGVSAGFSQPLRYQTRGLAEVHAGTPTTLSK